MSTRSAAYYSMLKRFYELRVKEVFRGVSTVFKWYIKTIPFIAASDVATFVIVYLNNREKKNFVYPLGTITILYLSVTLVNITFVLTPVFLLLPRPISDKLVDLITLITGHFQFKYELTTGQSIGKPFENSLGSTDKRPQVDNDERQ